MAERAQPTGPVIALLFNALVWGLCWIPLQALAGHGVHPLWATALVYGVALAGLLAWRPHALADFARHPRLLALALAAGATNVGFNWAVTTGDVVRVSLLFYLMPVWSMGLAWWLLGERPALAAVGLLALALGGVLLVLWQPGAGWPVPRDLADALAILGGFSFALTNALLKRWRDTPDLSRALAMFGGGALLSGLLATAGGVAGLVPALPAVSAAWLPWTLLLALAFLSGNLGLQYGAARLPARTTALIMLSEVVIASGSSLIAGRAVVTPGVLAGGALILLAALLSIRRSA